MKLKNSALQELYDAIVEIVNSTFTFSSYAASPIDEAFKECDEKLSASVTFAHIKSLQNRNDTLESCNSNLLEANIKLAGEKSRLEKELDDAKKRLNYFMRSRDDWWRKATQAKETLNKANADREELQRNLDYYFNKYQELKKDYETIMKEVVDLKARLNSVYGAATCMPEDYHKDGMYEVWCKLKEVADATSSELLGCFADGSELDDLIKLDLKDFMDEYKLWQVKKELSHVHDCLVDFCKQHHSCFDCPLANRELSECFLMRIGNQLWASKTTNH